MNRPDIDKRLKEHLQMWRGIEPRADFEAQVWRRVATATEPGLEWFNTLQQWFGVRPAWASVAAVLLAVAVGIGSALSPTQPRPDRLAISAPALHGQTLANSYLAMTSGAL